MVRINLIWPWNEYWHLKQGLWGWFCLPALTTQTKGFVVRKLNEFKKVGPPVKPVAFPLKMLMKQCSAYDYLTVYCNKWIKTVKSIKTTCINNILVIIWMMAVFQSFNIICSSLTQTIFEMSQFKMSCGTDDPLWLISRLNTDETPV